MDPGTFFRRFFGIGPRFNEDNRFSPHADFDEDEGGPDDIFEHFQDVMQQQMEALQQQMEDVFKHSGAMAGIPIDGGDEGVAEGQPSLRDEMLKMPDCEKQPNSQWFDGLSIAPSWDRIGTNPRRDIDLDGEVSEKGLSAILATPSVPDEPRRSSQHRSVSVMTVRRADGTVEERKTVRYADGTEETTRTVNGQKVDASPNTDENDLPSFDKFWHFDGKDSFQEGPVVISPNRERTDIHGSLLWRLFGFDFSQPRS